MPELPELHLFSRNLNRLLTGRRVSEVQVWRTRHRNFKNLEIREALASRKIDAVRREGKETHFEFEGNRTLAVHLMLCGQFDLMREPDDIKHRRFALGFDGNEWLVVSDLRGLAAFTLDPAPPKAPDALAPEFDLDYMRSALARNPKMCVKEFLVDQKIVRGIGNAYSDEFLWACCVAPQSLCGRLPDAAAASLHR